MALTYPPYYIHMPAHVVSDKKINRSESYTLAQLHALAWESGGEQLPLTTTAELAQACRLSERQIRQHITKLEENGYITKQNIDRNSFIIHPLRLGNGEQPPTGAAITLDNDTAGQCKPTQTQFTSQAIGGPPPLNPNPTAVDRRSAESIGGGPPPNPKQSAVDRRPTQNYGGGPPLNPKLRRSTAVQPKITAVHRRSDDHVLKHAVVLNKHVLNKQQHDKHETHSTPMHEHTHAHEPLITAIAEIFTESGLTSTEATQEAIKLIEQYGPDQCQTQLQHWPKRKHGALKSTRGLENPIGLYIKSLKDKWKAPAKKMAKEPKTWYTKEEYDNFIIK